MKLSLSSKYQLNNGDWLPVLGLGTYRSVESKSDEVKVAKCIKAAVKCGYRHIDTAWMYGSEPVIGQTLQEIYNNPDEYGDDLKRENFFITSKVWNTQHSRELVRKSLHDTLQRLQSTYLDLYLIHWPVGFKEGATEPFPHDPSGKLEFSDIHYMETWREMEQLVREGLVRGIGVSNFNISQLQDVLNNCEIKPVVNQIEVHPYLQNDKLIEFCQNNRIQVVSYATIGSGDREGMSQVGIPFLLENETLVRLAKKYKKSPAQICLRWALQRNLAIIPKSVHEERICENVDVFDFELNEEDMADIKRINCNYRVYIFDELKGSKFYPFNQD